MFDYSNSKNDVTSFSNDLTTHFTGERKIITLCLLILILSFTNIILCCSSGFVSALSYESSVGIGFTFNPTLSVSLSSSNLVISSLTPGSSSDSNSINVSIATNASYGYTLSATANSNNLTRGNSNDKFINIATDADLSSLTADNTWGYSTKLPNETNWNNYSGLSNSTNKTLIDNSNAADSTGSIDFKIAAKAGSTQPSGTYTNTINFMAVTKLAPMTLAEAYASEGKTMTSGLYTMQDMTDTICNKVGAIGSQLQVLDTRDYKVYWIAKLADQKCWMTQNLDLDIAQGGTILTSDNTDLSTNENVYTDANTIYALKTENETYGYTYSNGIATWIPERSTIAYNQLNGTNWTNSYIHPYSWDRLDNNGQPLRPDSNVTDDHGLIGNYYNWSAAIASNNSTNATGQAANSVCPKGWRLPNATNRDFGNLLAAYGVIANNSANSYAEGESSDSMNRAPLYFIATGYVSSGAFNTTNGGYYLYGTYIDDTHAYGMSFGSSSMYPRNNLNRNRGWAIRCVAK